jgi:hypothetical protein
MGLPDLPGGGLPGGGSGTASGGVQDAQVLKSGERLRTEFVIVFYWHEPLPTEPDPKGGYEEANQGDLAGGMMGGSGPPPGYPGYPAGPSGPPAGGPASSGGGGDSGWGRRLPGIDD